MLCKRGFVPRLHVRLFYRRIDMEITYAILIDGGFVRSKLGSKKKPLSAVVIGSLIHAIESALQARFQQTHLHLHRTYFYDARPLQTRLRHPLTGNERNLASSPMARNNAALHRDLEQVPFLALRYGHLRCRGWVLHDRWIKRALQQGVDQISSIEEADVVPRIEQKGVDMRIGLDIASLTLKKHVDLIVLVTADSDFVPAMKFARREGVQLCLVRLEHGVTDDLLEHADLDLEVVLTIP